MFDFNIKTLDVQFVHVIGNIFHVSFDLSIDITNVCKKLFPNCVYLIFCKRSKGIYITLVWEKHRIGRIWFSCNSRRFAPIHFPNPMRYNFSISSSLSIYITACTRRCVIISSSSFYFRKNPVHRVSIETDHFPRVEASTTSAQLTTDAST